MGKRGFVIGKDQTRQKQTKLKLKMVTTEKEDDFGKSKRSYTVQEKKWQKFNKKEERDVKKLELLELYTNSI